MISTKMWVNFKQCSIFSLSVEKTTTTKKQMNNKNKQTKNWLSRETKQPLSPNSSILNIIVTEIMIIKKNLCTMDEWMNDIQRNWHTLLTNATIFLQLSAENYVSQVEELATNLNQTVMDPTLQTMMLLEAVSNYMENVSALVNNMTVNVTIPKMVCTNKL